MDVMVRLDWTGAREVPARPVNVVLVQGVGDELILSFGHAPPPIAVAPMTDDQQAEYLKKHAVEVQQIGRFTLPVNVARTLMRSLQELLESRDSISQTASAAANTETGEPHDRKDR